MAQVPHISKIQELIYELPIEKVMTREVITVSPEILISELKEILRTRRISGTPVIEGGQLVGIVSIEDLIRALEEGKTAERVGDWMTRELITVRARQSVVEAVRRFAKSKVGRLPVVSDDGALVGILTGSDITRGLLEILGMNREREEEEKKDDQPIDLFKGVVSDETCLKLKYTVAAGDFKEGGGASSNLKKALQRMGVPPQVLRRASIAAYEAEMNLIIHTDHGGQLTVEIAPDRIIVAAIDDGPGIADVEQALVPGYSTAPNWIREMGFGAGMGLANIKTCADSMTLESTPNVGTRLEMMFNSQPTEPAVAANKADSTRQTRTGGGAK